MPPISRLSTEQIRVLLDEYFEVEFSFRNTEPLAAMLDLLSDARQAFILDWIRRTASTHIEIAYQFALQSERACEVMDEHMIEAWVLRAMEIYDLSGLHASLQVIQDIDTFVSQGRERASGCVFEEEIGVLLPFVHGLSGRRMSLKQADQAYTDSEVIYLPAIMAHLPNQRDNFLLYKATVAHLWAQTRFGTFQPELFAYLSDHAHPEQALKSVQWLESIRLDACISRYLPGLYRDMQVLKRDLGHSAENESSVWLDAAQQLVEPGTDVKDTLALAEQTVGHVPPPTQLYHGVLDLPAVEEAIAKRLPREKAILRVALKQALEDLREQPTEEKDKPEIKARKQSDASLPDEFSIEIEINGKSMPMPEGVSQTLVSIVQDLGDVPNDYLVPAGPGEIDLNALQSKEMDPEAVWSGTYHEVGAYLYDEWDYRRKHYRRNWCVMREMRVIPVEDDFVSDTLHKYKRMLGHLRRTFEAMRDEDRLLKRQAFGDGVDIDAFVESWADVHTGLEMSERLFTRMHRHERDIAVMFMVDMSGSTEGWVNQAEREALILLAESLETLGDRYAIYGFTGMSRKRCEVFPVKTFEQHYDDEVRARISGIKPGDYTRMGAAIRHLSSRLNEVDAKTRLLITLSDGKPDDYHGDYRGEYGIEDTRQALFEARRDGIHAFCITIDEEGQDYLPHMYGAANYTVIDEVAKLPFKVSDIYRKITS